MKETYLIANGLDSFKDIVFKHIVSEYDEFSLKDIESLLKLVDTLELENKKLYEIEFNNQLFTFTAILLP